MFRLHKDWAEEPDAKQILEKLLQRINKELPETYKKLFMSEEVFIVNLDYESVVYVHKEGDYISEINQKSLVCLPSDRWKFGD